MPTRRERVRTAKGAIDRLDARERAAFDEIMREYALKGRSETVQQVAEFEWDEQPMPVDEWLLDTDMIGETGHDMYPKLREDFCELFKYGALSLGGYYEAVLTGAIGWGKDFFATTAVVRMLYEILCLKNPQHTLGLAAGEPIHIVPISKTVAAARRVVFGGVCKKLALSKWFQGKYIETMEEVRFKKKGVYIIGGASQDAAALGLNVICAIVDESNFMGEGKVSTGSASGQAEDKATMIYNALARRVKSRYRRHGVSGLVLLVSSKRSTNDFTEKRIRTAIKDDDSGLFVRDYAQWNVHPEPFADQRWYKVLVSPKLGRSRLLEDHEIEDAEKLCEEDEQSLIFDFPEDFYPEFSNDIDGAVRDFGGIATDFAGNLFITNRTSITEMFDEARAQWFNTAEWRTDRILGVQWDRFMDKDINNEPVCVCCPGAIRHVHIDLSDNHCATGFCIGHVAGSTTVIRRNRETGEKLTEEAVIIHIDAVLRIVAPDGGNVDHAEVRGLVYRLKARGVPIMSVSMDQFSSPTNLQLFQRKGLKAVEVGERKFKLKPALTTRQALYEERITCPVSDKLESELKGLEISDDGRKVKKPSKGTKDLADALMGVVYYISENMREGVVLGPSLGLSVPDKASGVQWHSGGDVTWGDEDEIQPRPEHQGPSSGDGGYQTWIV